MAWGRVFNLFLLILSWHRRVMESHDYKIKGFNFSEVFRGFLDALALTFLVLTIGDSLSLPVSIDLLRDVTIIMGGGYASLRFAEFVDKAIEEVRSSDSE